ncbi:MAG: hypothetical protein PVI23_11510 [Maricaulaceae bacterium]
MRASLLSSSLVLSLLASAAAQAQTAGEEVLVSSHQDWAVYTRDLGEDFVCYAATEPVDAAPRSGDHEDVAFLVATWRSGASVEQPMMSAGYQLRLGAPMSVRVGSDRFPMFADEYGYIYVREDDDQARLVRAMKRGYSLRLETVTFEGTQTTYEFSLRGVTAAIDAANAACR